jgi:hypothetical protein
MAILRPAWLETTQLYKLKMMPGPIRGPASFIHFSHRNHSFHFFNI